MPRFILLGLAALLLILTGCDRSEGTTDAGDAAPALILISIDGFRYDYLEHLDVEAPTLRRLAAEGVQAERLIPVFPSKTFPNHYSLVTGLHPEEHGIVANTMRDDQMAGPDGAPARFSLSNRDAVTDGRWWGGEPLWVTAEQQGMRAGIVFWPGSEAEIQGVRPSYWLRYQDDLAHEARIDTVLAWLDLPAEERPGFLTLYFSTVDTEGHRHGPDADEVADAIEDVDEALALLVEGLEARGLTGLTDLVVVSDHGMVALSPERRVILDEAVHIGGEVDEVTWGEPVGLWPVEGVDAADLVKRIDALPHVDAYLRADVPERLRYSNHPRIPPIVLLADEGWTVTSQSYVNRYPDRPSGGTHGHDAAFDSMHGLFIAHGPRFRQGTTGPLHAVDVYGVLTTAMGLTPAPNSGDPAAVKRVLP
ncbi:MAG: ectonucleotide pyrophosphatase/phosphodiesterase [Bacteroidota bacterium]